MAILTEALFTSEKFRNELSRIIHEGDLSVLSATIIRKELEDKFELDRNSLKENPWKKRLGDMIDTFANEVQEQSGEEKGTSSGNESDQDEHAKEMTDDEDKDVEEESRSSSESKHDSSDGNMDNDDHDDNNVHSDSGISEAASPPPPKKKQQQKKTQQPEKQKSTGKKGTTDKTTADDESIKRLKSYIHKCGVRKVWQKELADYTTKKSQISKLKQILEELGVKGRPTNEKCEAVKASRELQAEIDSLSTDNILDTTEDGPSLRSSRLAKRKRGPIIQDDSDESDDDDAGAPLDVSFLGDQSDDSD